MFKCKISQQIASLPCSANMQAWIRGVYLNTTNGSQIPVLACFFPIADHSSVFLDTIIGISVCVPLCIPVIVWCVICCRKHAKHSQQCNITHRLTTPCEIPVTAMTTTVSDQGPDRSPDFNTAPQEPPPPYPSTSTDFSTVPQEPPPSYPDTSPDFNTALQGPPPPYPDTSPDAV